MRIQTSIRTVFDTDHSIITPAKQRVLPNLEPGPRVRAITGNSHQQASLLGFLRVHLVVDASHLL
jgi:hypothetical protein